MRFFYAMRSANDLKEYASAKHSGAIAFFPKEYLKTENLDRGLAIIVKKQFSLERKVGL